MGIIEDRRIEEKALDTHRWLVVGTDSFMSGWGLAKDGPSVAAWACNTLTEAKIVKAHVCERGDIKRVRIVFDGKRSYRPRNFAHFSVYVVHPGHRYLPGE